MMPNTFQTYTDFLERNGYFAKAIFVEKRTWFEKLFAKNGFNPRETREMIEICIIKYFEQNKFPFGKIISLYPNLLPNNFRASTTILLQQFSTPVPFAYIMAKYVFKDIVDKANIFDSCAGNGALLIPFLPHKNIHIYANELDSLRGNTLSILLQNYKHSSLSNEDATQNSCYQGKEKTMDIVVINPPFGKIPKQQVDGYFVTKLEHLITIKTLKTLKDTGRAAIIIGGNTDTNNGMVSKSEMPFWNYLNTFYKVDDVINCDGDLYVKNGTTANIRMILIDGRKPIPQFKPYTFDTNQEQSFESIMARIKNPIHQQKMKMKNLQQLLSDQTNGLGSPYIPIAKLKSINVDIPDSMELGTAEALLKIRKLVGNLEEFVAKKLQYSIMELQQAFSAEQVDALALTIFQIEKGMGFILGDQTGIGKGRVVAGILRYGVLQNKKPIFITEKPNLFSDMYRDLGDIGCLHYRPFIVNSKEAKTAILDRDGNTLYDAYEKNSQQKIIESQKVNEDIIFATYSQFNGDFKTKGFSDKQRFLLELAKNNIIILDEAHNASGESQTSTYFKNVLSMAKGVLYSSATFAKTHKSLPIFARKTNMGKLQMKEDEFVEAVKTGGIVMQEVLSNALVREGQMVRRERGYGQCEINYISLTEYEQKHKEIYESVTTVIRDIIKLQNFYIKPVIEKLSKSLNITSGQMAEQTKGTQNFGIDNVDFASRAFLLVNQLLFSLKVREVAYRVIERLKEYKQGRRKSVIVALANTNEAMISDKEDGTTIDTSFASKFKENLDSIFEISITQPNGETGKSTIKIEEITENGQKLYREIEQKIKLIRNELHISPIDLLTKIVSESGYKVAEITGRGKCIDIVDEEKNIGVVRTRKKERVNTLYTQFNNNEIDCLIINQSGSTGASAHAMPNDKVSEQELRQRCMIILQPELNINTELQKRGRIHRTGQKILPIYDYMSTMIPAEQRLMMMLKRKLSSLDANTSSNKEQNRDMMDTVDFFNKYGDDLVKEFLMDNEDVDFACRNPLKLYHHVELDTGDVISTLIDETPEKAPENTAYKVAGRVAILPIAMQEKFYQEITEKYIDYTDYLKKVGLYDLDVEEQNLNAETIQKEVVVYGNDQKGSSLFDRSVVKETCEVNILTKPYTGKELQGILAESLHIQDKNNDLKFANKEDLQQWILQEINKQIDAECAVADQKNEDYFKKNKETAYERAKKERPNLTASEFDTMYENAIDTRKQKDRIKIKTKLDAIRQKVVLFKVGNFYKKGYWYLFTGYSKIKRHDKIEGIYNFKELTMNFAIAGPDRNASYRISNMEMVQELNTMFAETQAIDTQYMPQKPSDDMEQWDRLCTQYTQSQREKRTIYTGNLLLAYSLISQTNTNASYDKKAKFVKYTTIDHRTKTGILLPRESLLEKSEYPTRTQPKQVVIAVNNILEKIQELPSRKTFFATYSEEETGRKRGVIGIEKDNHTITLKIFSHTLYKSLFTDKEIVERLQKEFYKRGDYYIVDIDKVSDLNWIFLEKWKDLKLHFNILLADWQQVDPQFVEYANTIEEDEINESWIRHELEKIKKEQPDYKPQIEQIKPDRQRQLLIQKTKMKMLQLQLKLKK